MDQPCKCPPPGLPAWMGTFADLMSLLMCFFVLLLAFSEMDVMKFKQIAGSMEYAFGVQNQLEVKDIPKGTSVIAQEFSPGRPEPTPIETIMQQTIDMTQTELEFQEGEDANAGGQQHDQGRDTGGKTPDVSVQQQSKQQQEDATEQQAHSAAKRIAHQLKQQIEDGAIEVESLGQQIVIRVRERGAFPAGSAFLQPKFAPVIRTVAQLLVDVPGQITISGHTDTEPLHSELYRSNWDLSAQRAVSVAHEMLKVDNFDASRLRVVGFADTHPLSDSEDPAQRARNRRVEITIMQGDALEANPISAQENLPAQ